jgi:glyoxylase-like metal-dependent hydrolase (beta-lactamase superfamily II)
MHVLQTGVVHMDACLNLDPGSPRQAECDHRPRDLAVLVHWLRHPKSADFLIDTGFDDSFAKHPPYGNYTEAMKLFNWINGVTNRQESVPDLGAQLARRNIRATAVFFTPFHPDHTGAFLRWRRRPGLFLAIPKPAFWARAAVANHFIGRSNFSNHRFFSRARDGASRFERGRFR